jgi:menaquinone-9 beta-reductase
VARRAARDSMASLNQEITIAGGGLAGLSLAIALRLREVPVTVLEAGSYPRHRVCGEFISGVTRKTLERLGIFDRFADAHQHRTLAWYNSGKEIHRGEFKAPALGISRHLLDERLWRRVLELGGDVRTFTRAKPEPRVGLVWTAGRRPCNGSWIGLKAHIRGLPQSADLEMHAGSNGYLGLAPVEAGWTNCCGLFRLDRSIAAQGAALLPAYLAAGGNHALAATMSAGEWRSGSFSAVAGFQLGRQKPIPGMLCLGDAESMIPPFTGNGMSMAFEAAACAIEPLVAWSHGELAWQAGANAIQQQLRKNFRLRLGVAGLLHPVVLEASGRSLMEYLSASRVLPMHLMLALTR